MGLFNLIEDVAEHLSPKRIIDIAGDLIDGDIESAAKKISKGVAIDEIGNRITGKNDNSDSNGEDTDA